MHESTRKLLCQMAFLACCAVPTMLSLGWCVLVNTPWYGRWQTAAVEQQLRHQFGLVFELQSVETVAPDSMHLHGVEIRDPENGQVVGKARIVSWANVDGRVGVRVGQPELEGRSLKRVWQLVHDRFLCDPAATRQDVNIRVDNFTLGSRTGRRTFEQLNVQVRPSEQTTKASLQFWLAGDSSAQPATISAERYRASDSPYTLWRLVSGDRPLPCSVLADYLPSLAQLGAAAEFSGTMAWTVREDGLLGDLSGSRFSHIDLGTLTAPLPHKMIGTATIELQRCEIRRGRIHDFVGVLLGRDGWIGPTAVSAAEQMLGIEFARTAGRLPGGSVQFDDLALRIEQSDEGFLIDGGLPLESGRGVMSWSSLASAYVLEPQRVDRQQLVGFLDPSANGAALTHSPVAESLLALLPASTAPRSIAEDEAPRVRISSRER